MRKSAIIKFLGYVLLFNALFMYISAGISFFLKETSFTPLLYSAVVCTIIGFFPQIFVEKIEEISFHEGLAVSVFGWLLTCFIGSVPYFMWGGEFSFANALFESVGGYTTTGATILTNIEILPKGLLFWRSATHFIGGLGIILFILIVLPNARGARASIYRTEVSGLSRLGFSTRIRDVGRIITIVYLSLTIAETILLWIFGMSFFDAVCHSFSTLATGGFSTKNNSIAYFDSIWIEIIITVFMLLGGMHFGLIYATFTGKKPNLFASKVVRTYLFILFIGIVLIAFKLTAEHLYDWRQALRHASFQVVSLVTTTGFATVDTSVWPIFTIILLIYFSIQTAMVGSTTGGIKFDRIYLFFQTFVKNIKQAQHPNALYVSKMNDVTIDSEMETRTMIFIIVYLFIILISTLALSAMNIDGITSFSASFTTLGNVGPGFGSTIGSLGNYSSLPNTAKYLLSVNMLLGRLEIMNFIVLFMMLSSKK